MRWTPAGAARVIVAHLGVGVLLGLAPVAFAAGQGGFAAEGPIERLTAASRERALECGRAGAECAVRPYELCEEENAAYSVRLLTPFSRVAEAAFEAEHGGRPLGRMGAATVNPLGFGLAVVPARRSDAAASIQRVEIERDGEVIQPIRATVGAVTIETAEGTTKQLTRGFFLFPARAFNPSSGVVVVLSGSSGRMSCTLDRQRLRALR